VGIGSWESHDAPTEAALLGLLDHGIRDFWFDDEPQAILFRSIRKLMLAQKGDESSARAQSVQDQIRGEEVLSSLLEACRLQLSR